MRPLSLRRNSGKFMVVPTKGGFAVVNLSTGGLLPTIFPTKEAAEAAAGGVQTAQVAVQTAASAVLKQPVSAAPPAKAMAHRLTTEPTPAVAASVVALVPSVKSTHTLPAALTAIVSQGPAVMNGDEYLKMLMSDTRIRSAVDSGAIILRRGDSPYTVRVSFATPGSIGRDVERTDRGIGTYLQRVYEPEEVRRVKQNQLEFASLVDSLPAWGPFGSPHVDIMNDRTPEYSYFNVYPACRVFRTWGIEERVRPGHVPVRFNGSIEYAVKVDDPDVASAFREAQQDAARDVEYHEGYSGTIGEAAGYKVMSTEPVPEGLVEQAAHKYRAGSKRGPASAIPYSSLTGGSERVLRVSFDIPDEFLRSERDLTSLLKDKIASALSAAGLKPEEVLATEYHEGSTISLPAVKWQFHPISTEPSFNTSRLVPWQQDSFPMGLSEWLKDRDRERKPQPLGDFKPDRTLRPVALVSMQEVGVIVPTKQGAIRADLKVVVKTTGNTRAPIKGWYFWGLAPT